tara:strand:- start:2727 stop:3191 length:465 start_codon:yes stop_codon:yes gene_type:complete
MDLDLKQGTACSLILLQEDETDKEIVTLLKKIGIKQYSLTWKVLASTKEVFSYRAESFPISLGEYTEIGLPKGLLHIPEEHKPLYPSQDQQLWKRFCSLAQKLRNQGLIVKTLFRYEDQETEIQTPTPFRPDHRLYVNQREDYPLEAIAQARLK